MKSFWIFPVIFAVCCAMESASNKASTQQKENSPKNESEHFPDEEIISLLPLKLLIEYQLKTQREFKQIIKDQDFQKMEKNAGLEAKNLTTLTDIPKPDAENLCTEINLPKNVSLLEMANTLNSDGNFGNHNLNKEDLQNIYNSLRNCFYFKIRNAKLWGPLWHCLNRLFLFFVFN